MKLLYFSWLREKIGVAEEEVSPPSSVKTVKDLLEWLQQRGGGYQEVLDDLSLVRVAVNQEYVKFNQPVAADDEIALFPPVTGG